MPGSGRFLLSPGGTVGRPDETILSAALPGGDFRVCPAWLAHAPWDRPRPTHQGITCAMSNCSPSGGQALPFSALRKSGLFEKPKPNRGIRKEGNVFERNQQQHFKKVNTRAI